MSTVLVTGGSGFVGSHIILKLLQAGHFVRTTVRSEQRAADLREMLDKAEVDASSLSFHYTDLTHDDGWQEAMRGCDFVMHVASPLPQSAPKHEDDVIIPARDGTLRVLRFACEAEVKRVVMTSSCGAVYYGHPLRKEPFDETSWTDLGGEMSSYVKSKTIAERAAWDFVENEDTELELTVINPTGIFGPILGKSSAASLELIARLLRGMPGCPQLYFGIVDVRDVAELHLKAMIHPNAKGERFIASAGNAFPMIEIAKTLRDELGIEAAKVPRYNLPNWIVRTIAHFDPPMRQLIPLLGKPRHATSMKAQKILNWKPRPREETIIDAAKSLIRFQLN